VGFQSILTHLDGPDETYEVVEISARLARETGAKLTLAEVVTPLPVYLREPIYGYPALAETLEKEAQHRLEAVAAPLRESGLAVDAVVLSGKTHEELVAQILSAGHDLVMTGSHTDGVLQRSSSTATRLCRFSPAPVCAVSGDGIEPFKKILATVDPLSQDEAGDELNQRVIEMALEIARLEGGEVFVLYAWGDDLPPGSMEAHGDAIHALAEGALNGLLEPYEGEIEPANVFLEIGEPAATICRVAEEREMGLVVLGTIARTGVRAAWLGNTAEKALNDLNVSVLAIKPSGFVSPLEPSA
jgi:universal stress protein E